MTRESELNLLKAVGHIVLLIGIVVGTAGGITAFINWKWGPELTQEQWAAKREQHNRDIERQLPGCTFKAFNDYRGVDRLVVVQCDGKATQSSSFMYRRGKYWASGATVVIR